MSFLLMLACLGVLLCVSYGPLSLLNQLHEDVLPPTLRRMLDAWNTDMDVVTKCCREMHVTHTRIYNKQRTLQASFEKFSHSKLYDPTPALSLPHFPPTACFQSDANVGLRHQDPRGH